MRVYVVLAALSIFNAHAKENLSDEQIRKLIIQQSISSYAGSCPCPYSVARNGSKCGARSAYSKPRGYRPICYPSNVTSDMVAKFRRDNL